MSTTTHIKAKQGFNKDSDDAVIARGHAVVKGMKGNTAFPNPPVDPNVLEAAVHNYEVANAEALVDGGKKAILAKKKERAIVIPMLKKLARYAEEASNNDLATLTSSGFEAQSTTKTPPQPLEQTTITQVEHGGPGVLKVTYKRVKKARTYDVRFGVMAGGNTMPASWTIATFGRARTPALITGLTPGATYAFQVRAFGAAGHTEWSQPATRMCE
jgi:hypothetical protein